MNFQVFITIFAVILSFKIKKVRLKKWTKWTTLTTHREQDCRVHVGMLDILEEQECTRGHSALVVSAEEVVNFLFIFPKEDLSNILCDTKKFCKICTFLITVKCIT